MLINMTTTGRPRSCDCGECPTCKNREASRRWYQNKTPEERRAVVQARDPNKVRASDNARYYRDWEKRRAAADKYQQENRERVNKIKKEWGARNPEKKKATTTLNNAIRDGKIIKKSCEVCDSVNRIHGHHDDYSKPLKVRWFCPKHHAEHHRSLRGEDNHADQGVRQSAG